MELCGERRNKDGMILKCVLASLSVLFARGCVRQLVGPSVRRSLSSWISEEWAKFEQNVIRNMKLCHLKDDLETSTRAVLFQKHHLLNLLISTEGLLEIIS